jgi:hypothetical protein
MIVPNPPRQGPTHDTQDKWYLCYFEYRGGYAYARYISREGWKLTATYFDTQEEALDAFQPFCQSPMPVSASEVSDHIEMEKMMRNLR